MCFHNFLVIDVWNISRCQELRVMEMRSIHDVGEEKSRNTLVHDMRVYRI
jgi:hypothetical protein